jgi:ABC-2 type transport system ATP-binding protein
MAQPYAAIDVTNLCKNFNGKPAVADVSLQVYEGEIFGFLGPNGGGKTTTIRMLCGLLTPDCGNGTCMGFDIRKDSLELKKVIGYMTQQFSLYEELTVRENLDFAARLYGIENAKETVNESIKELGLEDKGHQLVATLSGGWKQRLELSAALLHHPKLLLLDEPTAGVDPKSRRDFWDRIVGLSAEKITTLVTTHYMDEAEKCSRLAYISQGKILVRGTKEEIIKNSDLNAFEISGTELSEFLKELRASFPALQVRAVANVLRVCDKNKNTILEIAERYKNRGFEWREVFPNLEEIFISLG